MSRKDYEEIADIIRDSGSRLGSLYVADTEKLMRSLCKYFKRDNKLFIPKKFRERAKVNRWVDKAQLVELNNRR